ncbi:MAG TPA: hypothetical protein VN626_01970 [Clostridia bacterium]|nr:hypothetical protein [Clostridia bacterium]
MTIEATKGETQGRAPWSRDRVDRENEKGYPVNKAGMAMRAVNNEDLELEVNMYFHIQDPAYNPNATETNMKAYRRTMLSISS